MDSQIEDIYKDVLKEGWKIVEIRRVGNRIYVATYLPHQPMMDAMAKGNYDIEIMLDHTACNRYILEDDL